MSASESKAVIYAALAGNLLIAVSKFVAAAVTGSAAMVSEGIHSVVDSGNQVLLLYGIRRAARPPDAQFPFGYGKEIYFWSFVVAILIFGLGAGVSIYEGIIHLQHPRSLSNPLVNYVVLGLAAVFEGSAWLFAFRSFSPGRRGGYVRAVREGKDPTRFLVLFEDSAALLGLTAALAGVALTQVTGLAYFDGIASIVIGVILAGTAAWLAYETKGLLIGESARSEVIQEIRRLGESCPGVAAVNDVLTMHMGPDFILVNMSMDFEDGLPVGRVETAVAELDRRIKARFPAVKRVFVEAEPGPGPRPK